LLELNEQPIILGFAHTEEIGGAELLTDLARHAVVNKQVNEWVK
jgi:hypothetical protein